jgi:hypothetical protein
MQRSSGPRKTANLSESLHHQLNMYALAASAAGVGVLALTQAAEARIIYNPANVNIGALVAPYNLNLNLGGGGANPDFAITPYRFSRRTTNSRFFSVSQKTRMAASPINSGIGVATSNGFAAALLAGKLIGPGEIFGGGYHVMAQCFFKFRASTANTYSHTTHQGPWLTVSPGYLGLKFKVNGKIHYGWARFTNMSCSGGALTGTLTGYAYETIPNKPIIAGKTKGTDPTDIEAQAAPSAAPAGKPASLGQLALGFPGISIWRQE